MKFPSRPENKPSRCDMRTVTIFAFFPKYVEENKTWVWLEKVNKVQIYSDFKLDAFGNEKSGWVTLYYRFYRS